MRLNRAAFYVEKTVLPVSRVANYVGVIFLVLMMVLITVDVCLRAIFNLPILGPYVYEAIEFMMVILVFFGLAYCEIKKSNVTVDLLVSRLPEKAQSIIDSVTYVLSIGFFIILSWRSYEQAQFVRESGTVAVALGMPVFPFLLFLAFGCVTLSLALLSNLLKTLIGTVKK